MLLPSFSTVDFQQNGEGWEWRGGQGRDRDRSNGLWKGGVSNTSTNAFFTPYRDFSLFIGVHQRQFSHHVADICNVYIPTRDRPTPIYIYIDIYIGIGGGGACLASH
jgi:hypothetical protein